MDLTGIGGLFLGLGVFISAMMSVYNAWVARENTHTIQTLEKNTNSIKDALVKTTAESEHAKGLLQGQQQAAAAEAVLTPAFTQAITTAVQNATPLTPITPIPPASNP